MGQLSQPANDELVTTSLPCPRQRIAVPPADPSYLFGWIGFTLS